MRTGLIQSVGGPGSCAPVSAKELFRARFQRALRNCVRRHFSAAECFGVIWVETLEEFALTDHEQAEVYEDLLHWARDSFANEFIHSYSPVLFTASPPRLRERLDAVAQASL